MATLTLTLTLALALALALAGLITGCTATGQGGVGAVEVTVDPDPVTGGVAEAGPVATGLDRWPPDVLAALTGAGDTAYGWQRCATLYGPSGGISRSAGAYDPATGVGVLVIRQGSYEDRYVLGGGKLTHTVVGAATQEWEPATDRYPAEVRLDGLRSVTGVRSLFDLTTVARDLRNPAAGRPRVQELPVPSGGDQSLRLEGVPDGWPRYGTNPPDDRAVAGRTLGPFKAGGLLWLLDVWADGDEVERLRFETQDRGRALAELRFLSVDEVVADDTTVALPDCPAVDAGGNGSWRGFEPWSPTRSVPLQVTLDPAGRPYEVPVPDGEHLERADGATLVVPGSAEVLVMDGNAVQVDPSAFESVAVTVAPDTVADDGTRMVNADVLWQVGPDGREVLGLWLGPAEADVVAWDDFELGYGTDGGVGGVTTRSVVATAATMPPDRDMLIPDLDVSGDAGVRVFDLDGVPGDDSVVFSNGYGDGGFPLARGRNPAGEVVAVVIWRDVYGLPWRLAVPVGRAPATVTDREQDMIECLAGTRAVEPDGSCAADPEPEPGPDSAD